MNYADYVTTIATLAAYDPDDTDFLVVLPNASEYASNRIARELKTLISPPK